ncbi:hypothetical protein NIES208_01220 [[Limnothrix rosea] IAM M-220]|nr:hypothetical protein NIES208_01220 [[Limnothrix rosea] IAM M-220]
MKQFSQHISHFLIGIPGAGKSTVARWLQAETQGQIVSPDDIRQRLYGAASIQGDWAAIAAVIDQLIQEAIATQQTIIYDATNFNRQWRQDFLAQYNQIPWIGWHLQTPFDECWQRNQRRSRQVPCEILQKMARELIENPPRCEEGLRAIIAVPNSDISTLRALKKQHLQYLCD